MESIGINSKIDTKNKLSMFYYIQLVNKYHNELDIFKKYILVLYLYRTQNIKENFINKKKKPMTATQCKRCIFELAEYSSIKRFEDFIIMHEKSKSLTVSPYTSQIINFKEDDLWFEIEKMKNIEIGVALYGKI